MEISLTVNGHASTVEVTAEQRLLDVLRDDLGLTGAKAGCGIGECGACTVLLDGQPVNSCLVPAFQVHGREVVTVEGLGTPEAPGPVQRALVRAGGVQCGYCTPGVVVALTAQIRELAGRPGSTRDHLREGLSGNLCRCTGYGQILDAGEAALSGDEPVARGPDGIGHSVPRVDALDKVTGRCRFTADLPWPTSCLHGATRRSEHVHGRLIRVDAQPALAISGVERVLTWEDVPGELHYGNAVPDQPVLARDRIRFHGEAIAVVLATDPEAARAGAAAIEIEVEPLPPVTDPLDALAPGSPTVHDTGNLLDHHRLRKGDVSTALAEADLVLDRRYTTSRQEHLCLEPEAALAVPDPDGTLTVFAPSQNVFFDRHHLCRTLGLPRERVRVIQQPTGAAFGSREDVYAQLHAALGALLTGRPVRIVWTREETQVATTKRHPAVIDLRAGVDRDGTLRALQASVVADTGAYASWGPNVGRKMLVHAAGPYAIEHVSVDVRMVYTNNGISGAFRGFGAPQVLFAVESLLDELATELGIDPVQLRRHNLLEVGSHTATGQQITGSCALRRCVDEATAAAGPLPPAPPGTAHGRGMAALLYGIGYGHGLRDIGSAIVEALPDGRFRVRCGAVDYGQGALTVFTQIACEVLGIGRDRVEVLSGDSAHTPDSGSTVASRQTTISGEAVRQAAERLRDGLLDHAAAHWSRPRPGIGLGDAGVVDREGQVLGTLEELIRAAAQAGVRLRRQARSKASTTRLDPVTGLGDPYWPYAFGAQVVDVRVDLGTGRVDVMGVVAVHDVGRAVNPSMIRGQVAGGVAQGIGFALLEEHRLDRGHPLTTNLDGYRIPGPADVPEVHTILVEEPGSGGPFGAKGVGEPVLVAVAPAIANAIADATGARLRDLPIRPEAVLSALAGQGGPR